MREIKNDTGYHPLQNLTTAELEISQYVDVVEITHNHQHINNTWIFCLAIFSLWLARFKSVWSCWLVSFRSLTASRALDRESRTAVSWRWKRKENDDVYPPFIVLIKIPPGLQNELNGWCENCIYKLFSLTHAESIWILNTQETLSDLTTTLYDKTVLKSRQQINAFYLKLKPVFHLNILILLTFIPLTLFSHRFNPFQPNPHNIYQPAAEDFPLSAAWVFA